MIFIPKIVTFLFFWVYKRTMSISDVAHPTRFPPIDMIQRLFGPPVWHVVNVGLPNGRAPSDPPGGGQVGIWTNLFPWEGISCIQCETICFFAVFLWSFDISLIHLIQDL